MASKGFGAHHAGLHIAGLRLDGIHLVAVIKRKNQAWSRPSEEAAR